MYVSRAFKTLSVCNQCSTAGITKVHIKDPLPLIKRVAYVMTEAGFLSKLSQLSYTVCPTPYNRKLNVLSASLNKTFPLNL